jgi:hypothetical protein
MEEITEVKIQRRKDKILRQINYLLLCPSCKIYHARTFNTSNEATEEEINEWIKGDVELFYNNHVLDCGN